MLYLPRLFVYHCEAQKGSIQSETFKIMERRLLKAIINPAMIVTWVLGPVLVWQGGWIASGWLHAKLAARGDPARRVHGLLSSRQGFRRRPQRPAGALLPDDQRGPDGPDDRHRHPGDREAVLTTVHARHLCYCPIWPTACGPQDSKEFPVRGLRARETITTMSSPSSKTGCAASASSALPSSRREQEPPCRTFPFLPRAFRSLRRDSHPFRECSPMREIKLQDLKSKTPDRAHHLRRGARGREREHHAQAGAHVRDPQATRGPRGRDHRRRRRRGAAGRLRLPALGRFELPAGPGRHLRLAEPDPPLRPAHRRHGRRPDPRPQGRRALFRAAQGQHDQFRGSRRRSATRSISTT